MGILCQTKRECFLFLVGVSLGLFAFVDVKKVHQDVVATMTSLQGGESLRKSNTSLVNIPLVRSASDEASEKTEAISVTTTPPPPTPTPSPTSPCTPRPPDIQAKVDAHATPLIVFHTHEDWTKEIFFDRSGGCNTCTLSTNSSLLVEADAIVVHHFVTSPIPTKYCGQKLVFYSWESPYSHHPEMGVAQRYELYKVFDWKADYRLDTDLNSPYMPQAEAMQEICSANHPIVPTSLRNNIQPVAWVASHCGVRSKRDEYVRELAKHIPIASYGKCLNNAKIGVGGFQPNWRKEANRVVAQHKFYLSFENAVCDYYVTEKLVRALEVGLIPVFMGAPQARHYVPNANSALFVDDFDSPQALAARMHEINKNDTLFESFFEYRTNPGAISKEFRDLWLTPRPDLGCKLCEMIKNPPPDPVGVKYNNLLGCEDKYGTWMNPRNRNNWTMARTSWN